MLFKRLPIRHKLTVIIVGITFIALATAITVSSVGNYIIMRSETNEQLSIMADFSAKNLISSLDFLDQQAAKENLQALAFDPSIEKACVYSEDNILFASYHAEHYKQKHIPSCPDHYQKTPHINSFNHINFHLPIKSGDNILGTLFFTYDLTRSHITFLWTSLMNLAILLGALLIAYIIANIAQRIISRPVTELAEAAHKFVGHDDYSIYVKKTTDDELGDMVQAFNRMVHKMKERDDALVKAREDAVAANKMKSEFLANMSHELRTPLNSIMGMTRMMIESETLTPDDNDMANIVYKSSLSLLDIVNDILDISKIEAGSIVLEEVRFDIRDTVAGIVEAMAPLASAKQVSLSASYEKNDLPYIIGDPLRINRILTNLVSNAIKYTNIDGIEGAVNNNTTDKDKNASGEKLDRVDICINYTPLPDNTIELYCEVKDTGIGIPKDKQEIIFEKFSQADVSTTRKFGGTGLGLAITKELVELMDGSLGVESDVGKGSTFWFKISLPVAEQSTATAQDVISRHVTPEHQFVKKSEIPVAHARLLIAEDHKLNQIFIKRLLSRMGFHHLDIRENGALALNAYKENDYDLILMDCHMPEKSGYDVTEAIRDMEKESGKYIPIIAMTADAMKGTREKCLETGMDDYIAKPVDPNKLTKILSQWIVFSEEPTQKAPQSVPAEPADADTPVDMTVLKEYADTKEEARQFIKTFLEQSDETIKILQEECSDGENENWTEAAHKLKGGAGTIGAIILQKHCAKAQEMSEVKANLRKAVLKDIQTEYARVKAFLNKMVSG